MKNLWTKFLGLPLVTKILIIAGILIIGLWVFDSFTGKISDLKGYLFNQRATTRTAEEIRLENENILLRAEMVQAKKDALEEKGKRIIYEEKDKNLESKASAEVAKLDKALEQQAEEEKITAEPVDDLTRCERVKAKMIALGSNTARSIDCNEEYKQ